MRNLIHLSFSPLSIMLAENLCLKKMKDRGFQIFYIDLNGLIDQKVSHNHIYDEFIIKIKSLDELKIYLRQFSHKNTLLNIQIGPDKKNHSIIQELYSLSFKKSFFEVGTNPEFFMKTILRKIKYKFIDFPMKPDYVFRSGKKSVLPFPKNTKVFPIHYYDFDLCTQQNQNNEKILDQPYLVFLDQYLPSHPDFANLGDNNIDFKKYYTSVFNFLIETGKKYHLRPVIALHPKADEKDFEKNDITFIKGKTANLVNNANLVISHYSTAVSFAIIFKKPIVFIINNEILKSTMSKYFTSSITNYSKSLSSKLLNTDNYANLDDFLVYDSNKYQEYLFNYLTNSEILKRSNEELLVEYYEIIFKEVRQ